MKKIIVFLWPGAVPYMLRIYETLADMGYGVVVYNAKMNPSTPCFFDSYPGVEYLQSENLDYKSLLAQVKSKKPDIIVTSGWYNTKYKKVCKWFKQNMHIPTLCKIDSQYLHTWKQRVGFIISPFFIKPSFSYMLVPGVRQYYFARRLGYDRTHILLNGLSADMRLFESVDISLKKRMYPHSFLFVGRLIQLKGLELVVKAWREIEEKKDWTVKIIGTGAEKDRLSLDNIEGFELCEYMQQTELVKNSESCGVFLLPSTYEAWSVAMHEFSAAGMPLLCSEACGAVPNFLINGYNGYIFETGDYKSLKKRMEQFMNMRDEDLYKMAENSKKLAKQITPEFVAASIVSVLK